MIEWLEEKGVGQAKTQYKLRDWLFSRQRYWGEPFPVIHMDDGTTQLVPSEDLPLTLPELSDYKPTGTGEPPLAKATDWVNVRRSRRPARPAGARRTRCRSGPAPAGTTCATSTRTTTPPSATPKKEA